MNINLYIQQKFYDADNKSAEKHKETKILVFTKTSDHLDLIDRLYNSKYFISNI